MTVRAIEWVSNDTAGTGVRIIDQTRLPREEIFLLLQDVDSLIVASVAQMPDLLAQRAVESGYDLLRNRQARGSTVLIPAVLITRESAPEIGGWGQ